MYEEDSYSSVSILDGIISLHTDTTNPGVSHALLGFHRADMEHGTALSFDNDTAGAIFTPSQDSWVISDFRWENESYASYYENDIYHSNDSQITDSSNPIRFLTHSTSSGGHDFGAILSTVDTSIGTPNKALRSKVRVNLTDISEIKTDWVALRKWLGPDPECRLEEEQIILPLRNYRMIPDYEYNWIDASGGTELLLDENGWATVNLSFNFQFYNIISSTVYLGVNGYLSFTDPQPYHYMNVPFPSENSSLHYTIAPFWDDLQLDSGVGYGRIYVQDFYDHYVIEWFNVSHTDGEQVGNFEVVLYDNGDIIFNYDNITYIDGGYTCGLNLGDGLVYYNYYQGLNNLTDDFSIFFSYEKYHDLSVSLDIPNIPEPFNTYNVKAHINNDGTVDEFNVSLLLYHNDIIVNSTVIPYLPFGASTTITYLWTPIQYGMHNFTAYSPPVAGEEYLENNMKYQDLGIYPTVSGPVAIFRNNLAWDYNSTEEILKMYSIDYTIYNSSHMGTVNLSQYEKVIIESDQDQLFYDSLGINITWFESYAANGGILEIHACNGTHGGSWEGLYSMPGGINQSYGLTNTISINITDHSILKTPHIITDEELDNWDASAYGAFTAYSGDTKEILIDANTLNPVFIESDWENGTILATMQTLEFGYHFGNSKFLENVILFKPDYFVISSPNHSDSWEVFSTESISWTSEGTIKNVKLELYEEDALRMEIVDNTPNNGVFLWGIPMGLDDSTEYQIKISDVLNPLTYIFSDYFEIYNPSIELVSPDSSSSWEVATSHYITWTSIGTFNDVQIGLYMNDTFLRQLTNEEGTPNDGEYLWTIPSDLNNSALYQIRIRAKLNPFIYAFSDYFEIFKRSFTVFSPDNSSSWEAYRSYYINWTSVGPISDIKLELYNNDAITMEIVGNTSNDGEYYWTIPSGLDDSTEYQIKVTDVSNSSTYAFSDYFEIFNPSLTVISPDSFSSWEVATSYIVEWTSIGTISNIRIELYKDNIFEWEIVSSTPNDGEYNWTVPSELDGSLEYQIKISAVSNPSIFDFSDDFEIWKPEPQDGDFLIPLIIGLSIGGVVVAAVVILLVRRKKSV